MVEPFNESNTLSLFPSMLSLLREAEGGPTSGRLFAYGTLRQGQAGHGQMMNAQYFLGPTATAKQYKLERLPDGATILAPGDDTVYGELYQVSLDHLHQLDAYEGDEYRRAPVLMADGTYADAYVKK